MERHILMVEDEPKIADVVSAFLQSRGYVVTAAQTGREALARFEMGGISLVLLDLMLPDLSGEAVCAAIRRRSGVPIVMLTAKSDEGAQLHGLELGADDYILKPFSLKVLAAKLEAVLRRTAGEPAPQPPRSVWRNGDLTLDFEKNQFTKAGCPVSLTPHESRLLAALLRSPGKVFSREELIACAFGADFDGYDRAVDTHVKNLRQKIEDNPKAPVYIVTVHGLGYKFGGEQ